MDEQEQQQAIIEALERELITNNPQPGFYTTATQTAQQALTRADLERAIGVMQQAHEEAERERRAMVRADWNPIYGQAGIPQITHEFRTEPMDTPPYATRTTTRRPRMLEIRITSSIQNIPTNIGMDVTEEFIYDSADPLDAILQRIREALVSAEPNLHIRLGKDEEEWTR